MRSKLLLLICALTAVMFAIAGCASGQDKENNNTSGTSGTEGITQDSVNDGDYEAGRDGLVNDDDNGLIETAPQTSAGVPDSTDRDTAGMQTDDRREDTAMGSIVSDKDVNNDGVTDEAAFAPSYISSAEAAAEAMRQKNQPLSEKKIGWGLGKDRDSENRPIDAVKAQEKYQALGGEFLTTGKTICLTFDEGYENGYTAQILDTLKEKNVKAVFFVTYDYVRTAPELVQRMIDEGHTVGNHTWSHPSMPDISQKEVWAEVTKLHDYVKENFGYEMTLFRFPKGEFSERTLDDVHNLGYTSLFWSFAYADWDPNAQTDPAEALAKIEDSTHSGIYLLHAVSPANAQLLAPLLDYWSSQGYAVGAELG